MLTTVRQHHSLRLYTFKAVSGPGGALTPRDLAETYVEGSNMNHRTRSPEEVPEGHELESTGFSLDRWAEMLGIGSKAVLTTNETASILRISEKSVREGIKAGSIPSLRLGRRLLVPVPMLLSSMLAGNDQVGR